MLPRVAAPQPREEIGLIEPRVASRTLGRCCAGLSRANPGKLSRNAVAGRGLSETFDGTYRDMGELMTASVPAAGD